MRYAVRPALVLACVSASAFQSTPARADLDPQFDSLGTIDVQTRYQRPAAAVYLELQSGQSFQVQITHEDDAAPSYERYDTRLPLGVLRVYDPDENLVLHRVVDAAVDPAVHPDLAPDDLGAGLLADATLQATSTGTYTVRFSAGYEHSKLHVGVPPGTDYALSYGNGIWQDWRESQGPLWLWVPSHPNRDVTVELRHEGGSVTLWGENDAWSHVLDAGAFTRTVPAGTAGELWRLDDLSTDWKLRAGGDVPVLLASSQSYAEELDAGLLTVASGPLAGERVAHPFQKHMAEELVDALIAGAGDAASLRARATAVLTDPACAQVADGTEAQVSIDLLGRHVPSVVWSLDTWKLGASATSHPFLDAEHGGAIAPLLAWLPGFFHPCNPWGPTSEDADDGRSELLHRAALVAVDQMMAVTEDERLSTSDAYSTYPGAGAFAVGDRTWLFAFLAPKLAASLPSPLGTQFLAAYVDAMRRVTLDRRYAEAFVSARNQSSFFVTGMGALALGDPGREHAARAYAERFAVSADRAGWFPESLGPDATYNGMTHNQLALYFLQTAWMPGCSDTNVREALAKSYDFFNHTVAPEPDGKVLGGFNYGHRTNWWFADEQFGGAKGIARGIPGVAIWTPPETPATPTEAQGDLDYAIGQFENRVAQTSTSASTLLHAFQRFVARQTYTFPPSHADLRWPAEDAATDRLFDDEMYALRRNGYYVSIYVGNPAPGTFYTDKKVDQIRPAIAPSSCPALYTAYYEDTGVPQPSGHEHPCAGDEREYFVAHPFLGGGISTLWTPSFGSAILATNWSPLAHHGIVGQGVNPDTGQLERTWERYAATEFVSADHDGAEIRGGVPLYYGATDELSYTRIYSFDDEAIDVEVVVTNATGSTMSLDALWENIPAPVCDADCDTNLKGRAVGFARQDGTPLPAGTHDLAAVHIVDGQGHGLAVELEVAKPLSVHPVGMILPFYSERLQVGRIQIPFDASTLAVGQSTTLRYSLRTLDPVATVPAVPSVIDEPQILCADGPPAGDGGVEGGLEAGDPDASLDGGADGSAQDGGMGGGGSAKPGGEDDGGCGCRTTPARGWAWWWGILALFALLPLARRRRSNAA